MKPPVPSDPKSDLSQVANKFLVIVKSLAAIAMGKRRSPRGATLALIVPSLLASRCFCANGAQVALVLLLTGPSFSGWAG